MGKCFDARFGEMVFHTLFYHKRESKVELVRIPAIAGRFNLATAVNVLQHHKGTLLAQGKHAGYHFSLEVGGGAVSVSLSQQAPGAPLKLFVEGRNASDAIADDIAALVSKAFCLPVDPEPFYDRIKLHSRLRRTLVLCPHYRPVLYMSPFEGAVTAIISRLKTQNEANQWLANLREVCGVVPDGQPSGTPAFPGKWTLLSVNDRLLQITGIPSSRRTAIRNLAASLVGEPDLLEHLQTSGDRDHVYRELMTLPGINASIALHLLQYAYGFPDLLLDSNMLRRAVKRFYQLPELPDEKTIRLLAEPFAPWRSWWTSLLIAANGVSVIA